MAQRSKYNRKRVNANRPMFQRALKECCQLIKLLGLPVVQAAGEAEAAASVLNMDGIVDAVITDDGDAFLYGAESVLRNFSISGKDPIVDFYSIDEISSKLHLDRQGLLTLGLLLGCDYSPKGVPGVGKEIALKLLESYHQNGIRGIGIISRLKNVRNLKPLCNWETYMKGKIELIASFPEKSIIEEFLAEVPIPIGSSHFSWNQPDLCSLQEFFSHHLNWHYSYSLEKVVPAISLWTLKNAKIPKPPSNLLQPIRIAKKRIKDGIACFEVQWSKLGFDITTETDFYVTIENASRINDVWPELVEKYQLDKGTKEPQREKTGGNGRKNLKPKRSAKQTVVSSPICSTLKIERAPSPSSSAFLINTQEKMIFAEDFSTPEQNKVEDLSECFARLRTSDDKENGQKNYADSNSDSDISLMERINRRAKKREAQNQLL